MSRAARVGAALAGVMFLVLAVIAIVEGWLAVEVLSIGMAVTLLALLWYVRGPKAQP